MKKKSCAFFLALFLSVVAFSGYWFYGPFPFLKTTRAFSPKAGSCLFLASWNIRILSQKRSNEALEKIASILLKYDFISILEVRDPQVIDRLCELLKKKGRSYRYELSPPVGNTIKERYCFLYDASLVRVLEPGRVYPDPQDHFIRPPFYATFVSGQFDFTVIATHVIWGKTVGERRREISHLANVFRDIQDMDPEENDVILLGDFNRPPDDDLAFGALKAIPKMIFLFAPPDKSMIGDTNLYDNIWFQKNFVQEYMNHKGIYRFDEIDFENDRETASKMISDHRPIWALFDLSGPDDD